MKHIFYLMALFLAFSLQSYAQGEGGDDANTVTQAKWDWTDSSSPVYSSGTIESTTAWLKSDQSKVTEEEKNTSTASAQTENTDNFADYQMYVDASNGKLASNNGNAQFNQGTKLYVPVFNYGDKVSVSPYVGSNYTAQVKIGELEVANVHKTATTYTASTADIANGYVVITATGNGYIYSVTVDYVETAEAETALWDFKNGNPTSITEITIQNTTGWVESTATPNAEILTENTPTSESLTTYTDEVQTSDEEKSFENYYMYVDATNGKFDIKNRWYKESTKQGSGDVQVNSGTKLQIPIKSPGDKITVVSYPNYHYYTIGGIEATVDNTEYIASVEEYNQGYVEIVSTGNCYFYSIQWDAYDGETQFKDSNLETTGTPDAVWDWANDNPSGILNTSVSSNTATIASTVSNISMFIDATNSGSVNRDSDKNQAVRSVGVVFYFPCSVGDQLTCNGYNQDTYSGYTVGNDTQEHYGTYVLDKIRAKDMVNVNNLSEAVKSGVEAIISSSGKDGAIAVTATKQDYFYGYVLTTYNPFQEKCIYSSTFDEWEPASASTTATTITKKTKYSNEEFTFTLFNTEVDNVNNNTTKFSDWEHGYLMAGKNTGDSSGDAYIETSAISSITKVYIYEGVTGVSSERGWAVQAKDGDDTDWVTVFDEAAGGTYREETIDINRTNCQLRFYNLKPSENAYLFQLDIYGEIDFSAIPSLDCFTINGTTYYGDVFDEDADGNMVTTVELFASETMVSSTNPVTDILGEGSSTVGTVTYTADADACTVTIPVTLDSKTTNFIVYVVRKPWYTLTYYNSDGTALAQTQSIEKDTPIGEFIYSESDVTVATGKKFRGWAEAQKESRKYTTDDIVKSDLALYALVTDIEVESRSARYTYTLTNDYFDANDHEAFNPSEDGYWHDASHGWAFGSSGSIDILVGGNAFIIMSLCSYSAEGTISLVDAEDNSVCSDISVKADTDGALGTFQYEGEAGALTIKFSASGAVYLHKLTIANTADLNIDADGEYIVVPVVENQTDVERGNTLLSVIDIANAQSTDNGRVFVFLPNGTYDLGEECLTQISRGNVSLIGQSEKKTTIMNAAPVEGIAVSATLLNTSTGLYMQDLTLKNAYDYYGLAGDGRADCFQDNGSHTIMKNIRMLSYQDTYYSYNNNDHYFETSEIHGIVDYICGSGNVFFHECTLYNEGRGGDGVAGSSSQYCYITAPNTAQSCQFGYVFDSCTVTGTPGQTYCYGRSWNYYPRCVWINTTLADPSCIIAERWRLEGMNNCVPDVFAEYGTVDASGNASMPTTTTQTFFGVEKSIVLTAEEAATYSYESFSTASEWDPMAEAEQIELEGLTFTGNVVSWTGNADAKCYGVFINSIFQDFTKEKSYTLPEGIDPETDHICVRAANKNGGLGPNLENFPEPSSIATVSNDAAELVGVAYYDLSGRKLVAPQRGINIAIEYYSDGSQKSTKVLTK